MNTKFPIFLKPESLTFNVFGGSEIAEENYTSSSKKQPPRPRAGVRLVLQ